MLERVLSGGQSGADQAGWRAAQRFGIQTGGQMPTPGDAGPRRDECPPWTKANVTGSDFTLIFLRGVAEKEMSLVLAECQRQHRPYAVIREGRAPGVTAEALRAFDAKVVNIAGGCESSAPGIGEWVERYLCEVFRLMGFAEVTP